MKTIKRIIALVVLFALNNCYSQESKYVCTPCNNSCDILEFSEAGICSHCKMPLIKKENLKHFKKPAKKTVAFYLQDGVEVLDFAGPLEVFTYAGYDVFITSKTKNKILSQGVLKVIPDYDIYDAPKADIVAFFGGNSNEASEDKEVIKWLQSQNEVDYLFSVCTGAFVLAEAGILDGLTATTFHNALDNLENNYPKIKVLKNARFVDNGKVITTAGISAGIDGALHLICKLQGINEARKVAYYMEYDKWIAGEGVILDSNSPYKDLPSKEELASYLGTYEFIDGQQFDLKINEREQGLYASIKDMDYPVFYMSKDQFYDLSGSTVQFHRNSTGVIDGYSTNKKPGKLFKKIK